MLKTKKKIKTKSRFEIVVICVRDILFRNNFIPITILHFNYKISQQQIKFILRQAKYKNHFQITLIKCLREFYFFFIFFR